MKKGILICSIWILVTFALLFFGAYPEIEYPDFNKITLNRSKTEVINLGEYDLYQMSLFKTYLTPQNAFISLLKTESDIENKIEKGEITNEYKYSINGISEELLVSEDSISYKYEDKYDDSIGKEYSREEISSLANKILSDMNINCNEGTKTYDIYKISQSKENVYTVIMRSYYKNIPITANTINDTISQYILLKYKNGKVVEADISGIGSFSLMLGSVIDFRDCIGTSEDAEKLVLNYFQNTYEATDYIVSSVELVYVYKDDYLKPMYEFEIEYENNVSYIDVDIITGEVYGGIIND